MKGYSLEKGQLARVVVRGLSGRPDKNLSWSGMVGRVIDADHAQVEDLYTGNVLEIHRSQMTPIMSADGKRDLTIQADDDTDDHCKQPQRRRW